MPKADKERSIVKVEAVKELPKASKIARVTEYDEVIKQVLEGEGEIFKVSIGNKTMKQMYVPLTTRIKRHNKDQNRKENLELTSRNKQLYILKKPKQ